MPRRFYMDEELPRDRDTDDGDTGIRREIRDGREIYQDERPVLEEPLKRQEDFKRVDDCRTKEVREREERILKKKKFVRYAEGAKLYSMGRATFSQLALEAHAVYKINNICLVNTELFEEYLETFRV